MGGGPYGGNTTYQVCYFGTSLVAREILEKKKCEMIDRSYMYMRCVDCIIGVCGNFEKGCHVYCSGFIYQEHRQGFVADSSSLPTVPTSANA